MTTLLNVMAEDRNGFLMLSRNCLWQLGLKETIFLSELIYKYDYWRSKHRLTSDGYFFISRADITLETSLSKSQQTAICKTLMDCGLICVKKKKYNGCNFYKLNCKRICDILGYKYDDGHKMADYLANDKNGYVLVSKTFIYKIGLYESILVGEIVSKYQFWENKEKLDCYTSEKGYCGYVECFYMSRKDLEKETGLSKSQQIKAAKKLRSLNIIDYSKFDMGGCNYY